MSGLLSSLGWGQQPDPDNEVSIEVAGRRITGWQTVAITKSVEMIPNSFQVTAADQFPDDPARVIVFPKPGEVATVHIGSDLLITGYVDRLGIQTSPRQHDIVISGRGKCRDLVDCSADVINTEDLRGPR